MLHFANGKAELGPDAKAAIQKVAVGLKAYQGDYALVVSGHTSSVGGKALNKSLSKLRADAVANVLIESGVAASRVSTVGMGPDKPIADNKTKEGQAKNRRVEIDVQVKARPRSARMRPAWSRQPCRPPRPGNPSRRPSSRTAVFLRSREPGIPWLSALGLPRNRRRRRGLCMIQKCVPNPGRASA